MRRNKATQTIDALVVWFEPAEPPAKTIKINTRAGFGQIPPGGYAVTRLT